MTNRIKVCHAIIHIMIGKFVVFRLPRKSEHGIANKFVQKFYGQDSSGWKKRDRFHKKGFIGSIPQRKVMGEVIVIAPEDLGGILEFLREYSAEIYA